MPSRRVQGLVRPTNQKSVVAVLVRHADGANGRAVAVQGLRPVRRQSTFVGGRSEAKLFVVGNSFLSGVIPAPPPRHGTGESEFAGRFGSGPRKNACSARQTCTSSGRTANTTSYTPVIAGVMAGTDAAASQRTEGVGSPTFRRQRLTASTRRAPGGVRKFILPDWPSGRGDDHLVMSRTSVSLDGVMTTCSLFATAPRAARSAQTVGVGRGGLSSVGRKQCPGQMLRHYGASCIPMVWTSRRPPHSKRTTALLLRRTTSRHQRASRTRRSS
jgi:hypothetical protein